MLDIKFIRENIQVVKKGLKRRNGKFPDLDDLLRLEEERREDLQKSEQLKSKKKKLSAEMYVELTEYLNKFIRLYS